MGKLTDALFAGERVRARLAVLPASQSFHNTTWVGGNVVFQGVIEFPHLRGGFMWTLPPYGVTPFFSMEKFFPSDTPSALSWQVGLSMPVEGETRRGQSRVIGFDGLKGVLPKGKVMSASYPTFDNGADTYWMEGFGMEATPFDMVHIELRSVLPPAVFEVQAPPLHVDLSRFNDWQLQRQDDNS